MKTREVFPCIHQVALYPEHQLVVLYSTRPPASSRCWENSELWLSRVRQLVDFLREAGGPSDGRAIYMPSAKRCRNLRPVITVFFFFSPLHFTRRKSSTLRSFRRPVACFYSPRLSLVVSPEASWSKVSAGLLWCEKRQNFWTAAGAEDPSNRNDFTEKEVDEPGHPPRPTPT